MLESVGKLMANFKRIFKICRALLNQCETALYKCLYKCQEMQQTPKMTNFDGSQQLEHTRLKRPLTLAWKSRC